MTARYRCIYVIKSALGPVKIGVAQNAPRRFAELKSGSPVELDLHFIGKCELWQAEEIEAVAHNKLRASRTIGEWFNISAADAVRVILEAAVELDFSVVPVTTREQGNSPKNRSRRTFVFSPLPKETEDEAQARKTRDLIAPLHKRMNMIKFSCDQAGRAFGITGAMVKKLAHGGYYARTHPDMAAAIERIVCKREITILKYLLKKYPLKREISIHGVPNGE